MNDHSFDRLAKALAYRTDRREVARMAARSSIALLVGGLALGGRKNEKVAICPRTGNPANPWVYITVSESAVSAHRGHGDTIEPDFLNDPANCGGCGVVCGGDAEDLCTLHHCVDGACVAAAISCDDGNPCTESSCDPATGQCVSTPAAGRVCGSADPCTAESTCDAAGQCVGVAMDCDDGISCTIDTCDPAFGCVHIPDHVLCDDGNECTVNVCDPAEGCVSISVFDGTPCNHGNGACIAGVCRQTCDDPTTCTAGSECCSGICTCGTSLNTERGHCHGPFAQGFEVDASGWDVIGGIEGGGAQYNAVRVPSGTHGVVSRNGAFHAEAGQYTLEQGGSATTRWGGFSSVFPSEGYSTSIDIYLDMDQNPAAGTDVRFDWSSAVNGTTCRMRREFVFNVGTDPLAPGRFLVGTSNGSGRAVSDPSSPTADPITISASGWYTFRHDFRNVAGVLAVDMSIVNSTGAVMKTWTLSNPADVIDTAVGGNRYGWFASQEFPFLAFDSSARN